MNKGESGGGGDRECCPELFSPSLFVFSQGGGGLE